MPFWKVKDIKAVVLIMIPCFKQTFFQTTIEKLSPAEQKSCVPLYLRKGTDNLLFTDCIFLEEYLSL